LGYPALKSGVVLEMRGWRQVVDYPARDLTVTVQTGMNVAELQSTLKREGQWLPVDVPHPERTTLGGALAVNLSGPRRLGYGTLRDYVIGIRFLSDDGVEIQAGGRVVKNVAGYDLMKLHIGALGTLGVITQVTLKVRPQPETAAALVCGSSAAELGPLLEALHGSQTRPVAVEVLNAAAWEALELPPERPQAPWLVVVGFEEKAATVRWQMATLRQELSRQQLPEPAAEWLQPRGLWQRLTDGPDVSLRPVVEKVRVRPSQMAERLLELDGPGVLLQAHALSGIVWRQSVEPRGGSEAILWRAPATYKQQRPIWGHAVPGPTWEFMRQLKRTLDPDNVFNPGRLFGDL
jgi:glycolate oxidase FAD binding subunit